MTAPADANGAQRRNSERRADVIVVEDVWGDAFDRLGDDFVVDFRPEAWKDELALRSAAQSARCLVVRNRAQVDRRLLMAAPKLEMVARAGTGLDNVDVAAADELGTVVVAARGANARSVAEHTLALALSLARRIPALDRDTRSGGWDRTSGIELAGRTWGLLGAGGTGLEVARLATALGMDVVAFDPYVDPERPDLVAARVQVLPLDEVVHRAQVISVHLPLTDETSGLINADFLQRMRSDAYLINVGRGGTVNEAALAEALAVGQIAGAALDVRADEPPVRGPLESMDEVVLTPHVAGLTTAAQQRIVDLLAQDAQAVLRGQAAQHAVGATRFSRAAQSRTSP